VIWVHGDGLKQRLDEGRALEVGGLGPGSLNVHLLEDAGHPFEPGGQVRQPAPRLLLIATDGLDLAAESRLPLGEELRAQLVGIAEREKASAVVTQGPRSQGSSRGLAEARPPGTRWPSSARDG